MRHRSEALPAVQSRERVEKSLTPRRGVAKSWVDYARRKCCKDNLGDTNLHGHHIVMKKGQGGVIDALSAEARQILCKYGINPYCGCENLAITQNRCHSKNYAEEVLKALVAADKEGTRAAIESALDEMAIHHSKCTDLNEVDPVTDE